MTNNQKKELFVKSRHRKALKQKAKMMKFSYPSHSSIAGSTTETGTRAAMCPERVTVRGHILPDLRSHERYKQN